MKYEILCVHQWGPTLGIPKTSTIWKECQGLCKCKIYGKGTDDPAIVMTGEPTSPRIVIAVIEEVKEPVEDRKPSAEIPLERTT